MKMTKEEEEEKKENEKMGGMGSDVGGGKVTEECNGMKKEEEKEEAGKTMVVAIKVDQQSRELLTWTLVKVALPGDRVVALHVLPSSSASFSDPDGKSSSSTLEKDLESMVAVYEGFCNLKQIDLKLKVCKGSSLRRLLVRETNFFSATHLILGAAKNIRPIGPSPTSIAKYCAKKLPLSCLVLATSNGKILFQRGAENNKVGILRKSCFVPSFSELSNVSKSDTECLEVIKESSGSQSKDGSSCFSVHERNCSICAPDSVPTSTTESKEDELPAQVQVQDIEAPSSSPVSIETQELPDVKSGWPLIRRLVLTERRAAPRERAKASVVQWAMRLQTRYSTSLPVNSNHRRTKSDLVQTSKHHGERGTIIPSISVLDKEGKLRKKLELLQEKYSSVCRSFSYKELMNATSNFSPDNLIGKGGGSWVYKGCLLDGEVAVKILKPSEDAVEEFHSEIEIVTTLHHKNVISLLGFCFDSNYLILVYNFLSRGSLEEILHGEKENRKVLGWIERYKVAMGVAEALDYLHGGGSAQTVIHRDVKSSNILLPVDYEPQLSDFGLATWASTSTSHITCGDVAGTFGYLAPEYFMYGRLNEKVDVYAFGVVLLELLSGRKPISSGGPRGHESLVMWARPILQVGKVNELVDPSLSTEYDSDQMERMILAASLCIQQAPQSRPPIALVLKLLQGEDETLKWARLQVGASEETDALEDDVAHRNSNLQSHLNLALLDTEEDSLSASSTEHTIDSITESTSLEDDSQGRWSRSSSFD